MDPKPVVAGWMWGVIGVGVGLLLGLGLAEQTGGTPNNPEMRALNADLWMQTAAEYRACCLQAYHLARVQLEANLNKQSSCDDDKAPKPDLKPAVVFDLDETVFDNSG